MTDLDKVLYAHEYIIDNCSYGTSKGAYNSAGGCLGNGIATCAGYADGFNLLLDCMGIETEYVTSASLNHGWSAVKLDGEWYMVDATWDDTRKNAGSVYQHRFLLRTDAEFLNNSVKHSGWRSDKQVTCTSDRFSNWFVHSVAGTMLYFNGYWYYNSNNAIRKAKSDGSENIEFISGDDSIVTMKSITNGVMTVAVDEVLLQVKL